MNVSINRSNDLKILSNMMLLLRFGKLVNLKLVVIFFIFLPCTVFGTKTEPVTMPIIKNVRIDNFPIAIGEVIGAGIIDSHIGHFYAFLKNSPYGTKNHNTIPINFWWHKIVTTINSHIVKNLCFKGWGFAIVIYQKLIVTINSIYDKIRSIANSHGFFRNRVLVTTNTNRYQSNYDQSYIFYKLKRYFFIVLSYIGIGAFIISVAFALKASNIRQFFEFGFASFIFAMIAHVSIEKDVDLLFSKPSTAYQTNETGFAFNMLMVLIGIVIGLIVMHFLLPNVPADEL